MRSLAGVRTFVALLLAVALTGCSTNDDRDRDAAPADTPSTPEAPETPETPGTPKTPKPVVDLSRTEVCALVRAGVDAFNLGDIEGTLAEFEKAVPLAEQLAEDEPSTDADILLEAVRYYAAIPADEYVEASQTSEEFLRYKEFTLGECQAGGPTAPEDTGVPA